MPPHQCFYQDRISRSIANQYPPLNINPVFRGLRESIIIIIIISSSSSSSSSSIIIIIIFIGPRA